ncbi:MAG: helix-turn-helix domain-containing protein [Novipirellula sp. JB048]
MKLTRTEALGVIERLNHTLDDWDASEGPNTNWRGSVVKQMSRAVEAALDRLCSLSSRTDVDEDAREIVMAIDDVAIEFSAWAEAIDIAPDTVHPSGTPQLRTSLRALRNACVEPQRVLPEAIRDLMGIGTSDDQICKMYGFLTADGDPDLKMLAEEKNKPGTHFDPDSWEPPHFARRRREINDRWKSRTAIEYQPVSEIHSPKERYVDPTPIEDLIHQDVGAEQIARMKNVSVEEVEQYAAKHKLPLNGRVVKPADMNDGEKTELAKRQIELHPQSHPEITSMEDRVLACAIDGMKPVDIAEALSVDHPGLSWQKVSALIRQFEKEGEELVEVD